MTERRMCYSCTTIQTCEVDSKFKCKACGCENQNFSRSEDFPDHWQAHLHNKDLKPKLEQLLAEVNHEIEKFDTQWFKDWNTDEDVQFSFEMPEKVDTSILKTNG